MAARPYPQRSIDLSLNSMMTGQQQLASHTHIHSSRMNNGS